MKTIIFGDALRETAPALRDSNTPENDPFGGASRLKQILKPVFWRRFTSQTAPENYRFLGGASSLKQSLKTILFWREMLHPFWRRFAPQTAPKTIMGGGLRASNNL
mgnify:CR=1 FL=1